MRRALLLAGAILGASVLAGCTGNDIPGLTLAADASAAEDGVLLYHVTNVGNVPLALDATAPFGLEEEGGSPITVTPPAGEVEPLAPGESRTFRVGLVTIGVAAPVYRALERHEAGTLHAFPPGEWRACLRVTSSAGDAEGCDDVTVEPVETSPLVVAVEPVADPAVPLRALATAPESAAATLRGWELWSVADGATSPLPLRDDEREDGRALARGETVDRVFSAPTDLPDGQYALCARDGKGLRACATFRVPAESPLAMRLTLDPPLETETAAFRVRIENVGREGALAFETDPPHGWTLSRLRADGRMEELHVDTTGRVAPFGLPPGAHTSYPFAWVPNADGAPGLRLTANGLPLPEGAYVLCLRSSDVGGAAVASACVPFRAAATTSGSEYS